MSSAVTANKSRSADCLIPALSMEARTGAKGRKVRTLPAYLATRHCVWLELFEEPG